MVEQERRSGDRMAAKRKASFFKVPDTDGIDEFYILLISNDLRDIQRVLAKPKAFLSGLCEQWGDPNRIGPIDWSVQDSLTASIRPFDLQAAIAVAGIYGSSTQFTDDLTNPQGALPTEFAQMPFAEDFVASQITKKLHCVTTDPIVYMQFGVDTGHLAIYYKKSKGGNQQEAYRVPQGISFTKPSISFVPQLLNARGSRVGEPRSAMAHIDAHFTGDRSSLPAQRKKMLAELIMAIIVDRNLYFNKFRNKEGVTHYEHTMVAEGSDLQQGSSVTREISRIVGSSPYDPVRESTSFITSDHPTILIEDLGAVPKKGTPCLPSNVIIIGDTYYFKDMTVKYYMAPE